MGITVRMVAAFHRLGRCLQAIPSLVQQDTHHALADRVPVLIQGLGELTCAFGCPTQRRHGIATGVGIDDRFQVPQQRGSCRDSSSVCGLRGECVTVVG